MNRFCVLGPGGVGGFVAAALARSGAQVTVIARETTAATIAQNGISVQSATLGEFVARPAAVDRLTVGAEVLFVATKATALDAALHRIQTSPALVIPLLNGLDHLELIRERFGAGRVVAGVIRIEADRPEPGRVVHSSPAIRVDLAADDRALRARLPEIAAALTAAGIPTRLGASERQIMWSKLVRLNALASTTSAADAPIGEIRSDPIWRAALVGCVQEGAAVANADGGEIDPSASLAELDDAHPELGSSMQRDLAAGREPELDAIQGAVLRAGARHGVSCPMIARLAAQIAQRAGIAPPSAA